MDQRVCILDYGSGNVKSVANLFQHLKTNCIVSNRVENIREATHLVLPGVGAFGAAMKNVLERYEHIRFMMLFDNTISIHLFIFDGKQTYPQING